MRATAGVDPDIWNCSAAGSQKAADGLAALSFPPLGSPGGASGESLCKTLQLFESARCFVRVLLDGVAWGWGGVEGLSCDSVYNLL